MNIGSGNKYPSNALSNFAPHPFVLDGVEINSMEGLLQSFKFKNPEMQKEICKLVGRQAKFAGKNKKWWTTQILYWQGKEYKRDSEEYQQLLDKAYNALAQNKSFQRALVASGSAVLSHSIGKTKQNETVLTRKEFCSRLTVIRKALFQKNV